MHLHTYMYILINHAIGTHLQLNMNIYYWEFEISRSNSVFSAWGVSCCYVASSEILSLYFKKYRYLAFALAVLGYFVGMVAWPNVSQNLLDQYGYSQAMGYMACLHVMHIIAGILFFTPRVELEEDPGLAVFDLNL